MKLLVVLMSLLMAGQVMAGFHGLPKNKMAKPEVVQKALAAGRGWMFDDGGNISFGNGFYLRRIKFNGQPNVCHANNFLYAGSTKKCVKPVYDDDEKVGCDQYKTVQLKTQMVGTGQVCTKYENEDNDSGPCKKYATVKFNKGPRVKVALYKGRKDHDDPRRNFKGFTYLTLPRCND